MSDAGDETPRVCIERGGQDENVEQADIAFSAFDRADVGAMQPSTVGQLFLRYTGILACPADTRAKLP